MAKIIDIKEVSKYYRISSNLLKKEEGLVKAVDSITFSVNEGEIIGIVGESGSGKTTLARVILSLTEMTHGSITIDGIDISKANRKERDKLHKEIAAVFQEPSSNLNPRETIESSIMRPMIIHGVSRKEAREKAREALNLVKMDSLYLDSYPHQLSDGQLQRVAIARAIVMSPKIMVLDEPTSSLDVSVQAQILNLLLDLQEEFNLTYIIISHDINVIKYISDKIAVMYQGQLMEFDTTQAVCNTPRHPYTRALMDAVPAFNPRRRK